MPVRVDTTVVEADGEAEVGRSVTLTGLRQRQVQLVLSQDQRLWTATGRGRASLEELRQDLREITRSIRPDWEVSSP